VIVVHMSRVRVALWQQRVGRIATLLVTVHMNR
jgi:hypothetical protein